MSGAHKNPNESSRLGPSREKMTDFVRSLNEQRRTTRPVTSLNRDALLRGMVAIAQSHRLNAPVQATAVPLIFLRLPTTTKASDVRPENTQFVVYGWESSFGGALTVSVINKKLGWLGRAHISGSDPLLARFGEGQFCAVFVRERAAIAALDVDFAASADAFAIFQENWERARTYPGFLRDEPALFWDVARMMPNVIDGIGTQPEDKLSLGWVERYSDALTEVRRVLAGMTTMPPLRLPDPSDVPTRYAHLIRHLGENPHLTPDDLLSFVSRAAERSHEELTALILQEYHELAHTIVGDHSPLCSLARTAAELYLMSSASTLVGRRVPILNNGNIAYLDLKPSGFPNGCSPQNF